MLPSDAVALVLYTDSRNAESQRPSDFFDSKPRFVRSSHGNAPRRDHGDAIAKRSRSSAGRKEPHAQQPSQALLRPTGEPCQQFTASDVSPACSIQGNRCEPTQWRTIATENDRPVSKYTLLSIYFIFFLFFSRKLTPRLTPFFPIRLSHAPRYEYLPLSFPPFFSFSFCHTNRWTNFCRSKICSK